ncbi:MAG TPA: DNA-3-methyladenine glycosylase 2 family protein [Candidatus Aphodocola excrementigallinarum]|uniref:DNA-(apurinic or apyrimidinic site) lyase n=1 Tax=Candidatus Aphodocola excrementigallinarum TaxID=2840670 RepID=A0A9D1IQ26_9FIRM|nr:DNA-3-methyladenine glycosylase 2 family protein [Candidatus Aphodocola excrementigallinarum]
MIKVKLKKPFKLYDTVICGQIFRFFPLNDGSFDVILKDRVINIYQKDNALYVSSNDETDLEKVVRNYFDLDNNYEKMDDFLIKNDVKLKDAINFSKGLTMIKQDPFETVMEYIISANNGVPQISAALNNIAEKYGKKVTFNNKEYYLFPTFNDLKDLSESDYRACKVGFRDKYLKQMVDKLNNGDVNLDEFYTLDTTDSLNKLMENNGIGPKVASCILLFAYQKYDVFPIDTWVKKIMKNDYKIEGEKKIREFAVKTYGKYSAIALQYLFNYSRNKK